MPDHGLLMTNQHSPQSGVLHVHVTPNPYCRYMTSDTCFFPRMTMLCGIEDGTFHGQPVSLKKKVALVESAAVPHSARTWGSHMT